VIENSKKHLSYLTIIENQRLLHTPRIFFVGFTFPREYWNTFGCYSSGRLILSTENITAGPSNLE
jgi:hypothetical protein